MWDGQERRTMHNTIIPECEQVFKRLDDKLDTLVKSAEKINGRYEKHIEDSVYYRNRVERHDEKMKVLTWLFGVLTLPIIFLLIRVVK